MAWQLIATAPRKRFVQVCNIRKRTRYIASQDSGRWMTDHNELLAPDDQPTHWQQLDELPEAS